MTPAVTTAGRFVWHELLTPDPQKAQQFYSALFGWTTSQEDMGEFGKYTMIHHGEPGIGGVMPAEGGVPPHWLTYVTVDDVDAAVASTKELGGRVIRPPFDVPNVGRMAVIADPDGAVIAPYKGLQDAPEPEGPLAAGNFCYIELLTNQPEVAKKFYSKIFGWKMMDVPMGETGTYTMARRGEKDAAGIMKMPPEAQGPPSWLAYVLVDDVDATTARAEELGGMIYVKPRDIPEIGRFSVLGDPTGATFAIFKHTGRG